MKYSTEDIIQKFYDSDEEHTFIYPHKPTVFFENGFTYLRVSDVYYDVDEPESSRDFSVHESTDIDGNDTLSFEEL